MLLIHSAERGKCVSTYLFVAIAVPPSAKTAGSAVGRCVVSGDIDLAYLHTTTDLLPVHSARF